MSRKTIPTHFEVTRFISSLLPPRTNDVPLLYHVPRPDNYETAPVEQVVLSVTPTPNVYETIGPETKSSDETGLPNTIAFIHRPFTLDNRRIRDDLLVLASHTSFDENLTVGWNPTLAKRLGIDMTGSICVQGYYGNNEKRKVGMIAPMSTILGNLLSGIENEFGAIEHAQEGLSEEIHMLAVMNSFSADDVHHVLDMAEELNWVPSVEQMGRHVLYLTGGIRQSGMAAAKELGMTVVCVGHRVAEQWGITFMAEKLRTAFPALHVKEIYEDELPEEDGHDESSVTAFYSP